MKIFEKIMNTKKNKKLSKFGSFIEINQTLAFDKYEFHGPLINVGSKINYEDEKARVGAENFRNFLRKKLHSNKEVLGLDIFDGYNVDIVADLCADDLFSDDLEKYRGYFNTVICWALLEHVKDPFSVASNITDFMAVNGTIFYIGPWVWGYHPYPDDYWRISFSGLKTLFPDIEWKDWWYTGTNNMIGYRINEIRYERKVFRLKSDITHEVDNVSDRYMPYLNLCAVGVKKS